MTNREIDSIVDDIIEITKAPTVGFRAGFTGDIKQFFKVSNNEYEIDSHFKVSIKSFEYALSILDRLKTNNQVDAKEYLKSNSEFDETKPMYFHLLITI